MKDFTKDEAILKVKEFMGRDFSDEQLEIITHHGKPLNGIAGAGSGKTTVSIGNILFLELYKKVNPRDILSITFSKKASEEIEERYTIAKNNMNGVSEKPLFKTFHSFFYSLLRNIPEYRGSSVCSFTDVSYYFPLLKQVKGNGVKTDIEILEQYMRIRGVLLNYNASKDGLLPITDRHLIESLNFDYENYIEVISLYCQMKEYDNKIDFDDMQTLLIDYLENNPNADDLREGFHNSFKYIILDEYQDVSPVQVDIMDNLMSEQQIRNLLVVGDDDQCQPEDTVISKLNDNNVLIQNVKKGDFVKSYDFYTNKYVNGKVTNINSHFEGELIEIQTDTEISRYTLGHKSLVNFTNKEMYHIFLMKDIDENYTLNFTEDKLDLSFQIPFIMRETDTLWLLGSYESRKEQRNKLNYLINNFAQTKEDVNKNKIKIFNHFKLTPDTPTVSIENFELACENKLFEIRSGAIVPLSMSVGVECNDTLIIKPINDIKFIKGLTKVYSLEIEDYGNYVSDNVLTHNCIYSFRGSQSEYIINFLERYKNARRKYIGKNYRCKSNILNEVIPMIEKNKIRVEKDLVAHNEGGTVTYLDTDNKNQFLQFKEMLLNDIKTMNPKDIVVLVRFNKHRKLLADRLAEEGVPIDIVNQKYLLQNDTFYKVIFDVAKAIKSDNPTLMRKHMSKCFRNLNAKTLDGYNTVESSFVHDILNGSLKTTKEAKECVKNIYESENAYVVVSNVWKLVRDFYTYMIKKKKVNHKDLNGIVKYIIELSLSSDGEPTISWDSLVNAENYKKAYLTDFIGDDNVFKVFTTHSVKGLEFKKVYLYGLDSDIVSEEDMRNYHKTSKKESKGVFNMDETYKRNKVSEALSLTGDSVEEERRVFYVACTRAIDDLVIGYSGENMFQLLYEMKSFKESV